MSGPTDQQDRRATMKVFSRRAAFMPADVGGRGDGLKNPRRKRKRERTGFVGPCARSGPKWIMSVCRDIEGKVAEGKKEAPALLEMGRSSPGACSPNPEFVTGRSRGARSRNKRHRCLFLCGSGARNRPAAGEKAIDRAGYADTVHVSM